MSRECAIEFHQDGDQLELDVQSTVPPPANPFNTQVVRPRLQLNPGDLDQLRAGAAPQPLVDTVALAVSQWLLQPDLDLPLLLGLNANPQPPWRLVFSTEKIRNEALRQGLAELPVELIQPPGFGIPLTLHNGVGSIIHRLPKMGLPPAQSSAGNWPLRVLIVRSNPADLGGGVPAAALVRDAILQARPDLAPPPGGAGGWLQVEVLSSENTPGVAGRPTAEQLSKQVLRPYDVLVYLGHGDLQPNPTGGAPLGVLLLETEDGQHSRAVDAQQLSVLLHQNPIPVVLLIGCLTAAEIPAAVRPNVAAAVPGWIRGSQGVAQALVNGRSGVHFVIGMRFKVESQDAVRFLQEFFHPLLNGGRAGDLEAAVQAARLKLHLLGSEPLTWAAPVVFRTRGEEPTFPYLSTSPPPLAVPLDPEKEKLRSELWQMLADINWQLRPSGLHTRTQGLLDGTEQSYLAGLAAQAALLLPERHEVDPRAFAVGGETSVEVLISLDRDLQVGSLDAVVTSTGGRLLSVEATNQLEASQFDCFASPPRENRIKIHLQRDQPGRLPAGPLLKVTLALPGDTPVVYVVGLETVRTQPAIPLCSLSNAVIVPSP